MVNSHEINLKINTNAIIKQRGIGASENLQLYCFSFKEKEKGTSNNWSTKANQEEDYFKSFEKKHIHLVKDIYLLFSPRVVELINCSRWFIFARQKNRRELFSVFSKFLPKKKNQFHLVWFLLQVSSFLFVLFILFCGKNLCDFS